MAGKKQITINGRRVRLSDLGAAGLLQAGDDLTLKHRNDEIAATVTEDVQIRLEAGDTYRAPSPAAAAAAGVTALDGWNYWYRKDRTLGARAASHRVVGFEG